MPGNLAGQFENGIGITILTNTNNGDVDVDVDVDVGDATNTRGGLAWMQNFMGGDVQVTVGQSALKIMLDQNNDAGWDRTSFFAQPLAGNPMCSFPILHCPARMHSLSGFASA